MNCACRYSYRATMHARVAWLKQQPTCCIVVAWLTDSITARPHTTVVPADGGIVVGSIRSVWAHKSVNWCITPQPCKWLHISCMSVQNC
jgi:hypothetical protein